jgi:hypothetical protein
MLTKEELNLSKSYKILTAIEKKKPQPFVLQIVEE